jgi:hypothetical protein
MSASSAIKSIIGGPIPHVMSLEFDVARHESIKVISRLVTANRVIGPNQALIGESLGAGGRADR